MTTKKLFTEFPQVTAEQWVAQVIKDLKGESFDDKLGYKSPEGIAVKPFYTQEDLAKYSICKPLFSHTDWEVCVEIDGSNETEANKNALHQLNNGATALLFWVSASVNLSTLLNQIGLPFIGVQFVVEGNANQFKQNLLAYVDDQNLVLADLSIVINTDPIEHLLRTGNWRNNQQADKAELIASSINNKVCVNGNIYQLAGAPAAYEIACTLVHAHTYIDWFEDVKPSFHINTAVGNNYFFEIAKLRALRKVFSQLLNEYGLSTDIHIHAETSSRYLTVFDAHNNLLRTTTAAMAASIGGCNSLVVKPFDVVYQSSNEFSERLSRNIQLILKSESYFDKVADVSAGSYFIEELTEQLTEKAWNYFVEIEKQGGLIDALQSGHIQQTIKAFAAQEQQLFDEGKYVLVGTNKFPNTAEEKQSVKESIQYGNEAKKGEVIETLSTIRLSAKSEKERLQN